MTPHLYGKLLHVLTGRGAVPTRDDFTLTDLADGIGPRVTQWNTGRLGVQPTESEINAITDTQAQTAVKQQQAEIEAARDLVKAWLLFYLRDKLGRNPTPAERQAAITAFRQAWQDAT